MKNGCEKCSRELEPSREAYICSHECTFCPACTETFAFRCPNCSGELVRRPRRRPAPDGNTPTTG